MSGDSQVPIMKSYSSIQKVATGVRGLDEVLNGGIPKGAVTLFSGGPGSGKTIMGLEFLLNGANQGKPGIFLSFEEREEALRSYVKSFGWNIDELLNQNLIELISARIPSDAVLSGDFDLRGTLGILHKKAEQINADRIVIDAPDVFLRLLDDITTERSEFYALHENLLDSEMTTIITVKRKSDNPLHSKYEFMEYMADCVIQLDQRVFEQITTRRLRVIKYRGSAYGRNEYPFCITDQGAWIIPVTRARLKHRAFGESLSTGVSGLDKILGGGFRRNSCNLITGSSGTGKTTFACTFTLSAANSGERVLYIDFEEAWDALVSCMKSPGIDLTRADKSGKLRFISSMPESQGVEEHLIQSFRAIEDFQPKHLIVDAISACRRMGSDHAAFDFLLRLIDHCKQRGITTLLTNLTSAKDPRREITGIDLSSVIDTVILLRNIEGRNGYKRELAILKSRGRAHSSKIQDFEITDHGIVINGKEGRDE